MQQLTDQVAALKAKLDESEARNKQSQRERDQVAKEHAEAAPNLEKLALRVQELESINNELSKSKALEDAFAGVEFANSLSKDLMLKMVESNLRLSEAGGYFVGDEPIGVYVQKMLQSEDVQHFLKPKQTYGIPSMKPQATPQSKDAPKKTGADYLDEARQMMSQARIW